MWIGEKDVRLVAGSGEMIADYPNDTPYPSCLVLGFVQGRPLHLVTAVDHTK